MTVIQKRTHHGPVEGRLSFIQENTLVTPFAGIEYAACVAMETREETSNGSKNHRGKLAMVQRNMERNPQRLKETRKKPVTVQRNTTRKPQTTQET